MYKRFAYRDDDGHDMPGTSRKAWCAAVARTVVAENGGIVLDDSRAIIATDERMMDEIVRVSGDRLTRDQARALLASIPLWWDEATETARVVDRDTLLHACWGGPWVAALDCPAEDRDWGQSYVEDGEVWVAWEGSQTKTPAYTPGLTRFESREAALAAAGVPA